MQYRKNPQRSLNHMVSVPIIYAMVFPIVILDAAIEIYHRICFPLYGIRCLRRSSYIKMDRHRLSYLNWYEKINCAYCGYANGVFHYWTVIAAETEKYWCAIKHSGEKGFIAPEHHKDFAKYGDEKQFKKKF